MQKDIRFNKNIVKLFTVISFTMSSVFFLGISPFMSNLEAQDRAYKHLFDLSTGTSQFGDLNQPAGIAIDNKGNIYVADTINSRIVIFDSKGKLGLVFGREGSEAGELKAPMALDVDSKSGKIYVADSANNRIQVFSTTGKFLSIIDLDKGLTDETKSVRPIGIAVAPGGNIYISDAGNNYIRVYSPKGDFLFRFGGFGSADGKFCVPVGLFVDKDSKVYVVDMNNFRLQVFKEKGDFLYKIGELGDAKGNFGRPKDVCVDDNGFIYISDASHRVVQIFDNKGNFSDLIGVEDDVDLQFISPFGLAAYKGRLYITDRLRKNIRVYEINS